MKTHTMTLEVVLPDTSVPVQDLLYALSFHLKTDAERYMKVHKVGTDNPAVCDKTDAADLIRKAADQIRKRSRERWEKHQTRKARIRDLNGGANP